MEQLTELKIAVKDREESNVLVRQNNEDDHSALPSGCQRIVMVERVTVRR